MVEMCCVEDCDKKAEWEIWNGKGHTATDTFACTEHVGALLTDASEHRVYPVSAEPADAPTRPPDVPTGPVDLPTGPPLWSDVAEKVLVVVARQEPATRRYGLRARLIDDLGFDSLDITEVIMHLEDEFHVALPEDVKLPERVEGYVGMILTALSKRSDMASLGGGGGR